MWATGGVGGGGGHARSQIERLLPCQTGPKSLQEIQTCARHSTEMTSAQSVFAAAFNPVPCLQHANIKAIIGIYPQSPKSHITSATTSAHFSH